ncbi:MAG: tetratricopeptide repeat protein [Candidatus Thioglobus sp.]
MKLLTITIFIFIASFTHAEVTASELKEITTSANNGNIKDQTLLGMMYYSGEGVPQDLKKGASLLRKSAKQGDELAKKLVYMFYLDKSKDDKKPKLISSLEGFDNGADAYKKGDYKTAFNEFKPLAERGHLKAQFGLGVMYEEGMGVLKDDKEAFKWYRKAAEQGDAAAQFTVAVWYDEGIGVLKDDKEAFKWYRKAAEQDHAEAQYYLASMYRDAKGTLNDKKEAFRWYSKAAEQGNASAQLGLAMLYARSDIEEGVTGDLSKAKYWIKKAYENSDTDAQKTAKDIWNTLELWKY